MNLEDVKKKIKPTDRVIMAYKKVIPLQFPVDQETHSDDKPNGLWYAIGTEWIDYAQENMPSTLKSWQFVYKLEINEPRMCLIRNEKQMEKFHNTYGHSRWVMNADFNSIDWASVVKKYSGIEIAPYQGKYRFKYRWYYGWDVASGCIWARDGISHIYKVEV